jgi:hypothetical protein
MRDTTISSLLRGGVLTACCLFGTHAGAQPAAGTMKQDAASSGSTAVATEGFDAAKKVESSKDATEAKIQAGVLLATGNSRSLSATSVASLRMRRRNNELSASAAANYARSASDSGEGMETTVENYQGKLRYDRFVSESVALFLSFSGRERSGQGRGRSADFSWILHSTEGSSLQQEQSGGARRAFNGIVRQDRAVSRRRTRIRRRLPAAGIRWQACSS